MNLELLARLGRLSITLKAFRDSLNPHQQEMLNQLLKELVELVKGVANEALNAGGTR